MRTCCSQRPRGRADGLLAAAIARGKQGGRGRGEGETTMDDGTLELSLSLCLSLSCRSISLSISMFIPFFAPREMCTQLGVSILS